MRECERQSVTSPLHAQPLLVQQQQTLVSSLLTGGAGCPMLSTLSQALHPSLTVMDPTFPELAEDRREQVVFSSLLPALAVT